MLMESPRTNLERLMSETSFRIHLKSPLHGITFPVDPGTPTRWADHLRFMVFRHYPSYCLTAAPLNGPLSA